MNKSESDKLLNAIGGVNDRWVKELMEEPDVKASHKVKPIVKRIIIAAAAALLSISLVITVAANSDAIIAAIFERRQNLVDNKIGHIDESVTEGNITLTMDSVKIDSLFYDDNEFHGDFTVSFHNEDGIFENGLKYGGYKMQHILNVDSSGNLSGPMEIDGDGRKWYTLHGNKPQEFDAFYPALNYINFGLDNPSDTITLESTTALGMYGVNRIIFYDLTSADGSIKYADELCVEFTVTKEEAQPLRQLHYSPDITFEIEGVTFEIDEIYVEPDNMSIHFTNSNADRVNIAGVDCYAINYLTKLANSDEYFAKDKEILELDAAASKQGETFEEQIENLTAWMMSDERVKLEGELGAMSEPTEDKNILNECYEILVEIKPESGAEISSVNTSYSGSGATVGEVIATMKAQFYSPIYVDDIVRVYARKIGDPTKEITIWVPADDKGLDTFR